ncbi:MAG TPA: hypothetical protein VHD56_19820 [Tepidisphaeraceae bacterium]|nr:hypothetical protein [Tepidisphaeraceae bacterium]
MADPTPNNPPPLNYAAAPLSGMPDWFDSAEEVIHSGKPPSALARLFRSNRNAVNYYALSMSRRYSPEKLTAHCVGCNGPAETYMIRMHWRAVLRARFADKALSDVGASFVTHHAICIGCYRTLKSNVQRLIKIKALLVIATLCFIAFGRILLGVFFGLGAIFASLLGSVIVKNTVVPLQIMGIKYDHEMRLMGRPPMAVVVNADGEKND